jgi:hypothetical protein
VVTCRERMMNVRGRSTEENSKILKLPFS